MNYLPHGLVDLAVSLVARRGESAAFTFRTVLPNSPVSKNGQLIFAHVAIEPLGQGRVRCDLSLPEHSSSTVYNVDESSNFVPTAVAFFAMASALGEGKHDHAGRRIMDPQLIRAVIDISERLLGARSGLFDDYIKRMEELK